MSKIYIIEMPGKPAREVTNINYIKVSLIVEKAGGKIYPKEEPTPQPYIAPNTLILAKDAKPNYEWSEVLVIAEIIANKHFGNCQTVLNIPIRIGRRTRKKLGCCHFSREIGTYGTYP